MGVGGNRKKEQGGVAGKMGQITAAATTILYKKHTSGRPVHAGACVLLWRQRGKESGQVLSRCQKFKENRQALNARNQTKRQNSSQKEERTGGGGISGEGEKGGKNYMNTEKRKGYVRHMGSKRTQTDRRVEEAIAGERRELRQMG